MSPCPCGDCRRRQARHPERVIEHRRPVGEIDRLMDAMADAVLARYALNGYYAPAASLYAARVAPMVNLHRVVTL